MKLVFVCPVETCERAHPVALMQSFGEWTVFVTDLCECGRAVTSADREMLARQAQANLIEGMCAEQDAHDNHRLAMARGK